MTGPVPTDENATEGKIWYVSTDRSGLRPDGTEPRSVIEGSNFVSLFTPPSIAQHKRMRVLGTERSEVGPRTALLAIEVSYHQHSGGPTHAGERSGFAGARSACLGLEAVCWLFSSGAHLLFPLLV